MTYLFVLSALVAIFNLVLGIFILIKTKKNIANISFFFLSVVVFGWIISNLSSYIFENIYIIDIAGALTYAFSALIVSLFYLFVYSFSTKLNKLIVRLGLYFSWTLGIIFCFLSLFTNLIQEKSLIVRPHIVTISTGSLYFAFFIFYVLFILWSFYILFLKRKLSKGIEKQKITLIIDGFAIAAFFGMLGNLFVMALTKNLEYQAVASLIGPLFTLFLVYFIFIAILKYRLFDINLAIKRGVVRIFSFIIIFGVYLFAILSLKDSINLNSQSEQTTFLIVATLIVVITIEPIRKLVHGAVDKIFETRDKKHEEAQKRVYITLKSQQKYENLISSINGILKELFEVENVEFLASQGEFFKKRKETYHFFKSTGRVLIPEELPYRLEEAERYFHLHEELEDSEYSAIVSIGQEELFVGCFALGKRKNNKAYTVEEVRELKKLQDDFTEALLNARLYQQAIQRIKI